MDSRSASLTESLNEAPLSFFHLRAMLTAGMGFFTDAYDLFIIGAAMVLIEAQWHPSPVLIGLLGSTSLIAAFVGAFIFGRIADVYGRKAIYGLEAAIMAVGAIASAFAPNITLLIIFRFILGVGIGGDYPVSAVIMSEYANRKDRGRLVTMVFSNQALGLVVGPAVALVLLAGGVPHAIAWRLMLGLGALPALAVIYLRRTLPESPRFKARVQGDTAAAAASLEQYSSGSIARPAQKEPRVRQSFASFIGDRRNLALILATGGCWLLLDYALYGNTISTPLILKIVAPGATLLQSTAWSLIIFAVAAAPGYITAMLTVDRIGHKRLQWIGFVVMAACFAFLGLVPGATSTVALFLIVYALSYFFTEFGPNVTTFIIPAEVYPVTSRTTGHGLAAGIGKVGAFIGVFVFPLLSKSLGLAGTLMITALFAVIGALLTQRLPEPSGQSLEQMGREERLVLAPAVGAAAGNE